MRAVGEVLLGRAKRLRSAMDEAVREVRGFAGGVAGRVKSPVAWSSMTIVPGRA